VHSIYFTSAFTVDEDRGGIGCSFFLEFFAEVLAEHKSAAITSSQCTASWKPERAPDPSSAGCTALVSAMRQALTFSFFFGQGWLFSL
jgi:hypothetical protein